MANGRLFWPGESGPGLYRCAEHPGPSHQGRQAHCRAALPKPPALRDDEGVARMNILGQKKIVLLGMMSKIPVAGAVWGTMQYLVGFQRLGYDVYYVEAHARTPSML